MRYARWVLLAAVLSYLMPVVPAAGQDAPAAPAAGKRLAVPDAKAQAAAEKLIKGLYKAEFAKRAPADRAALGAKLLAQAKGGDDEPAVRFVLLREARDLLAAAGDVGGAFDAADAQAAQFKTDAVAAKLDVLAAAARAPRDAAEAARLALELMDDAAAAGRFTEAGKAAAVAKAASSKLKDKDLAKRVRARATDLAKWQQEHKAATAAEATLKGNPGDPAANLAAGAYRCFRRGDWAGGLPLLAKGSDAALGALARRELKETGDGESALVVAEAWWGWGLATFDQSPARVAAARARAAHWYERALPELTGLKKSAVETRLAKLRLPPDGWTVRVAKYSDEVTDRLLDAMDETIPDEGTVVSDDHRIRIAGAKKSDLTNSSRGSLAHYGPAAAVEKIRFASGTIEVGVSNRADHTGYVIGVFDATDVGHFMNVPLNEKITYRWSVGEADGRVVMTVTKDGTELGSVSIPSDQFQGFAFGTHLRYTGDRCELRVTLDEPEE
jgi:hypothetical protein